MKYTIMGFSQSKLVELGLDTIDATLLRYFVDFKESKGMKFEVVGDKPYYWLKYDGVLRELPILKMKKCTVQSRFFKMRDAGVLTHYIKREGGTYSYFGIGDKYFELVGSSDCTNDSKEPKVLDGDIQSEVDKHILKPMSNNQQCIDGNQQGRECVQQSMIENQQGIECVHQGMDESQQAMERNQQGIGEKQHVIDGNLEGCESRSTTKNSSTKDPSTKSINTSVEEESIEIIDYLNNSTGKHFKSNTKATVKLIKERRMDGFTVDDFKTVIDNMKSNWAGTKFQQYLAPTTLFGAKFETYLNADKDSAKDSSRNLQKRGNVSSDSSSKATSKDIEVKLILKEDM